MNEIILTVFQPLNLKRKSLLQYEVGDSVQVFAQMTNASQKSSITIRQADFERSHMNTNTQMYCISLSMMNKYFLVQYRIKTYTLHMHTVCGFKKCKV